MTKGESVGVSMMLKIGMEVSQYYTVSNYGQQIPQKELNTQDRTIVAYTGMKPSPKLVLPGHSKEKFGKKPPPDVLIMDNLETLLTTTVDKDFDNTSGAIVDRFIKPRASTIFGHPVYLLYGPGPSTAVSGPHEEFFNSALDLWMGVNNFSDE